MATIGIMSMHRIFNYGSTLQAYALRRLLEKVTRDDNVSFVDYAPGRPLVSDPSEMTGATVARALVKARKYGSVDARLKDKLRFLNHKRRYGARYLSLIGVTSERNYSLDLDLEVIGSDEVFNCVQSNANVGFSPDLFGIDSPARSVVSYAASFGNTTLDKINKAGVRTEVAHGLASFSSISVRDENSAQIVGELLGSESPAIHLDPTLVCDLMHLRSLIPEERPVAYPYMIVYGYSGRLDDQENQAIRRYADRRGLQVLALGGLQTCADRFVDCNPFELLAYFRDAEAVVTDTFHGSIFSIINEVPFASLVRKSSVHGYGNEEKLSFLLRKLDLQRRVVTDINELETIMDFPVDFGPVREILDSERVRTLDYLTEVCRAAGILGE